MSTSSPPTAHASAAPEPADSLGLTALKTLVLGAAALLFLLPLATPAGVGAGVGGVAVGALLARFAAKRRLRVLPTVAISLGIGALAFVLSDWVTGSDAAPASLGVGTALQLADALQFGLLALAVVFLLRVLTQRWPAAGVLEVGLVVAAVAYTFGAHRNHMIHQPRFFTDWALTHGLDPTLLLKGCGALAISVSVILLLRAQQARKLVSSLLIVAATAIAVVLLIDDERIQPKIDTNGLGLSDEEQKAKEDDKGKQTAGGKDDKGKDGKGKGDGGKGKGDGEGKGGKGDGKGGGGQGGFADSYDNQSPPQPVAVVLFKDDYDNDLGVLYFRQLSLSRYDGNHLVAPDPTVYDRDVLVEYPLEAPVAADAIQELTFHVKVPTSMYLMVSHPQPIALSHATELLPLDNPNPSRFVAAYDVVSHALSVPVQRLMGRRSVPDDWDAERRQHYLAIPDDPRYEALADEVVREVDPRFMNDDVMRAWEIKRYLEKNGYYTRTETYKDAVDPAAAFLFGTKRGYCVHFAHAAVYLLRSQGIAARVALGYAAPTRHRSGGSAMLILNHWAHAWPEIHVEGVGWVTFDIYPEDSDEPPPAAVDVELENLLGELARDDKSGGKRPEPDRDGFSIPWGLLGLGLGGVLVAMILGGFGVKVTRRVQPALASPHAMPRVAYRAALDALTDVGHTRDQGETREAHARRVAQLAPSFIPLTGAHLSHALGRPATEPEDAARFQTLARQVRSELRKTIPWHRRLLGALNPFGWTRTR